MGNLRWKEIKLRCNSLTERYFFPEDNVIPARERESRWKDNHVVPWLNYPFFFLTSICDCEREGRGVWKIGTLLPKCVNLKMLLSWHFPLFQPRYKFAVWDMKCYLCPPLVLLGEGKVKSKWSLSLRHRKFDFTNYTHSTQSPEASSSSRPIWWATDCVHFFLRGCRLYESV